MIRRAMGLMRRLLPGDARGENAPAVAVFRGVGAAADLITGRSLRRRIRGALGLGTWPVVSGTYAVGDPTATIAICCLTSDDLIRPLARLPSVAIAGRVQTPNLGIEKIVWNVTANPSIRFLLLCGKESAIFHPGQALESLLRNGVTESRRIVAAMGHLPVLGRVSLARIEAFRRQVELVDRIGETDLTRLAAAVRDLAARAVAPFEAGNNDRDVPSASEALPGGESHAFAVIRPGGRQEPLVHDPKGFFVIDLDRGRREIICRHFLPDNTPRTRCAADQPRPCSVACCAKGSSRNRATLATSEESSPRPRPRYASASITSRTGRYGGARIEAGNVGTGEFNVIGMREPPSVS